MPASPSKAQRLAAAFDQLIDWFRECGEAGRPAPTNHDICERFNLASVGASSGWVKRLEREGRIRVERSQMGRVISAPDGAWRTAGTVARQHKPRRQGRPPVAPSKPREQLPAPKRQVRVTTAEHAMAEAARKPMVPITVVLTEAEVSALLRHRPSGSAGEVIAGFVREVLRDDAAAHGESI